MSQAQTSHLILALDVKNKRGAIEIAESTSEFIHSIKVNYPIVLSCGLEVIGELSKIRPVIADFKVADVPHISAEIARLAFDSGAKAIITHGFVGSDSIKAILREAGNENEVYVVTELSSEGGKEFLMKHAIEIASMAKKLGCHGIVAPATRPERIRELKKAARGLKVISPGVGAQGGKISDTIRAGADYVIVGRTIYASENPRKTAEEIYKEIEVVLKDF
jgi:orotidine-5'-phosphate decarboxylase